MNTAKKINQENNLEDMEDVIDLSYQQDLANERVAMVVEDDPTSRMMLEKITKKIFSKVYSFESVEAAEEFLDKKDIHIDVLISDYFLPGEKGSVLARTLKKLDKNTATFIVSGAMENIKHELYFNWVDSTLPKPLCYKALLKELKK